PGTGKGGIQLPGRSRMASRSRGRARYRRNGSVPGGRWGNGMESERPQEPLVFRGFWGLFASDSQVTCKWESVRATALAFWLGLLSALDPRTRPPIRLVGIGVHCLGCPGFCLSEQHLDQAAHLDFELVSAGQLGGGVCVACPFAC